jgi:hypothetical protein
LSVAICTGIPGNFRYPDARIEGSHDHVGLPRRFRRDAAMAGAEFAMALDHLWEQHEAKGVPMACTIGRFHTDTATHGLTMSLGGVDPHPGLWLPCLPADGERCVEDLHHACQDDRQAVGAGCAA